MKRIVHVIGRNGKEYNVPMTAEQAAFYMRLAEFKAIKDPSINFSVLVAEQREKELQHIKKILQLTYSGKRVSLWILAFLLLFPSTRQIITRSAPMITLPIQENSLISFSPALL